MPVYAPKYVLTEEIERSLAEISATTVGLEELTRRVDAIAEQLLTTVEILGKFITDMETRRKEAKNLLQVNK